VRGETGPQGPVPKCLAGLLEYISREYIFRPRREDPLPFQIHQTRGPRKLVIKVSLVGVLPFLPSVFCSTFFVQHFSLQRNCWHRGLLACACLVHGVVRPALAGVSFCVLCQPVLYCLCPTLLFQQQSLNPPFPL